MLGSFLEPLWGHKVRTEQVIASQAENPFVLAVEIQLAQKDS